MATREELYNALRNADASGDNEGAAKLAAYIQNLPAEQPTKPTSRFDQVLQSISQGERFKRGALDIGQGLNQLFMQMAERPEARDNQLIAAAKSGYIQAPSKVSAAQYTADVNSQIADYENRLAASGKTGIDWTRIGGRATATLPIAALAAPALETAPVLAPILAGAAQGGATGAIEFAPTADERAKNVGIGAAAGALLPGVGAAAKPIGAVISGAGKAAVAGLKSTPFVKGAVSAAEDLIAPLRYGSWNKALFNRVNPGSKPITAAGQEGQRQLKQRFDDAYEAIWGNEFTVKLPGGKELTAREAEGELKTLPKLASAANRRGDVVTSDALKAQEREILNALPTAVRQELDRVDAKFAEFARLRVAGSTLKAAKTGVFTPEQLLNASRQLDRSAGKGAFARGDALFQQDALSGLSPLVQRALLSRPADLLLRYSPAPIAGQLAAPNAHSFVEEDDPFAQ